MLHPFFLKRRRVDETTFGKRETMTPQEAESIFYEFGDCLERQLLLSPEEHGPHLRLVSREGLRKAILLWVAKQRYEGIDVLYRQGLPGGQRVAPLEMADNVWGFTALYGPMKDGEPVMGSKKEEERAASLHDDFVDFLLKLSSDDPGYWPKVQAQLGLQANDTGLNKTDKDGGFRAQRP